MRGRPCPADRHADLPLKVLCQLGGWSGPDTLTACYQQPDLDALRQGLRQAKQSKLGVQGTQSTVRIDSMGAGGPNEKPRLDLQVQAGQRHLKMGLGRLELPTSRLSGPYKTGQIPAKCRTFTGRTHDLPYFSGKHAGICRDLSTH